MSDTKTISYDVIINNEGRFVPVYHKRRAEITIPTIKSLGGEGYSFVAKGDLSFYGWMDSGIFKFMPTDVKLSALDIMSEMLEDWVDA